jgi:hypothetical protein
MSRTYIVLVNGIAQRMGIEEYKQCDEPKQVLYAAPENTKSE